MAKSELEAKELAHLKLLVSEQTRSQSLAKENESMSKWSFMIFGVLVGMLAMVGLLRLFWIYFKIMNCYTLISLGLALSIALAQQNYTNSTTQGFIVNQNSNPRLSYLNSLSAFSIESVNITGAPSPRRGHTAVFIG